jgi:hypothetical protein
VNAHEAGVAAAKAIIYNLPLDGFGDSKRLEEYALIWGNAAARAVVPLVYAADDEEIGTGGHDLVVSLGDCELHGRCTCGKPLGLIKPDRPLDELGQLWEHHVMTEVRR